MISLKKLLVVTQTSSICPSVISQSIRIAKKQKSHVTFLRVAEERPKDWFSWINALPPQELITDPDNAYQLLNTDVEQFHHNFLSIDTCISVGVPFIEISKKVQQDSYDLVILATKTNDYPHKEFFGSTTVQLMRKCPCPILAIGTNEDKPIKRILAAIDIYSATDEEHKFNKKILLWAENISELENAELHVVHVWKLAGEDYLDGWGYTSEKDHVEMVMKEKQDKQQCLDKIISNNFATDNLPIIQLIEGIVQEKIIQYVDDHHIDLVVMGTASRHGLAGLFIGNTAESTLSKVPCSVLTLKPDGFISPVK